MIKPLAFSTESETKASAADIARAESLCGFIFPPALREFYHRHNGGYPNHQNAFFPVPKKFDEFWAEYCHPEHAKDAGVCADIFYGLTTNPGSCDAIKAFMSLKRMTKQLYPIVEDLFGNQVLLALESTEGSVYFRDHELWDAANAPHLFPIADSLDEFYNGLTSNPYSNG